MQVYPTEALRNVILLSRSGAGKTMLCETLLLASGAVTRLGQIADGNTTSDYEPEAIERRSSVQTAVIPCEWKGKKLNFLDTQRHADFVGEVLSALSAAASRDCSPRTPSVKLLYVPDAILPLPLDLIYPNRSRVQRRRGIALHKDTGTMDRLTGH